MDMDYYPDPGDAFCYPPDDDFDDEEESNDGDYAYQGFGPVCLRYGCPHWGGDGLCDLAIDELAGEELAEFCPLGG